MISNYKYQKIQKMIKENAGTDSSAEVTKLKKELETLKQSVTTANKKIQTLETDKASLESRVQALESKQ